jgi:predicted transcriptional regulator of viral defense system
VLNFRINRKQVEKMEYTQVSRWVSDLPRRGQTAFSLAEAIRQFPGKPAATVKSALARLAKAGEICSVWKGFYAIVLPEYGLRRIVPPLDYIDLLMKHLGRGYYIALLSAAAMHGASHQAPQAFEFVSDGVLHPKTKNGTRLLPVYKKRLPMNYVIQKNVRTGVVLISTPELTALDLLIYQEKSGGLNAIATVLAELSESLDFSRVSADFFAGVPAPAVQQLGCLLGEVLGERALAEELHRQAMAAGVVFRKHPMAKGADQSGCPVSDAWKIIINYEVETDV